MSKTMQGHRTKLDKTKKTTEALTVSNRGQTTVILCSTIMIAYSHCRKATEKVQSPARDGT